MSELSFPWPDTTDPGPQVGDGRKYTDAEWSKLWRLVFSGGRPDITGVFALEDGAVLGELEVTSPGANQIQVGSGAALVNGKAYLNDATVNLAVPSAGPGSTRQDRVVVRAKWDAGAGQYTARLAIVQGSQAGPPALVQTENATWEISVARYTVFDTGAISGITQTGERVYCDFATGGNVPVGGIIMWSGSVASIPARWQLCNGANGTPDLRDRFVVGAGGAYAVGANGGAATVNLQHTHTNTAEASHTHAPGTLANANESSHTHPAGAISVGSESSHTHAAGAISVGSESSHTHTQGSTGTEAGHVHHLPSQTITVGTGFNPIGITTGSTQIDAPNSSHTHTLATNQVTGSPAAAHYHTNPATGAGSSHSHSASGAATGAGSSHSHTASGAATGAGSSHTHGHSGATAAGSSHNHTMNSQLSTTSENRPPYYALAFIMRLR